MMAPPLFYGLLTRSRRCRITYLSELDPPRYRLECRCGWTWAGDLREAQLDAAERHMGRAR